MKEKLIDIIIDAKRCDPETGSFTEFLADRLIANGVTISHEPFRQALLDKLCLAQENALGTDRALLGEVIRMVEGLEVKP